MTLEQTLVAHLESFGIQRFCDDTYWEWGGRQLGDRLAEKTDRLRAPMQEETATPSQARRFYDHIADPRIAAVVHSLKADAILKSGLFVESRLPDTGRILDAGCAIGYLTQFYAFAGPRREVHGWDVSGRSTATARRLARERGVTNVSFACVDLASELPDTDFDVVCSTQTLAHPSVIDFGLSAVAACLKPGGQIVAVEALPSADSTRAFIGRAKTAGLALVHFDFVLHRDIGVRQAYPCLVFSKGGTSVELPISALFEQVLVKLRAESAAERDES
jgi:2-polyprenyl-3-methyl-5-hydroxy-6-metoxy-1,4-benzoquinol methylase